jgi:hypothetical protein
MTYHSDPTRWTQSPGDAPELLRGGLEAAGREGPNDLQMRALALKLAAVGTGAALAAGAAGAKASTTAAGAGFAATGSSVLTKIAVSVALIGAAATGGTLLLRQPSDAPRAHEQAPVVAPASVKEVAVQPELAQPTSARLAAPPAEVKPVERAPVAEVTAPAEDPAVDQAEGARAEANAEANKAERRERRQARAEATERATVTQQAAAAPAVVQVKGEKTQVSEIDLLTKARSALAARPREAYRLTEEHKAAHPQGMFAQERDALAVEALQRAGDLEHARALAEVFLKRYPSSPAAHRFRETMNLR